MVISAAGLGSGRRSMDLAATFSDAPFGYEQSSRPELSLIVLEGLPCDQIGRRRCPLSVGHLNPFAPHS